MTATPSRGGSPPWRSRAATSNTRLMSAARCCGCTAARERISCGAPQCGSPLTCAVLRFSALQENLLRRMVSAAPDASDKILWRLHMNEEPGAVFDAHVRAEFVERSVD